MICSLSTNAGETGHRNPDPILQEGGAVYLADETAKAVAVPILLLSRKGWGWAFVYEHTCVNKHAHPRMEQSHCGDGRVGGLEQAYCPKMFCHVWIR